MLKIDNLKTRVAGNDILNGLSLEVKAGEVHAIMGPNGSGKSTLAQVIAGHDDYEVTGSAHARAFFSASSTPSRFRASTTPTC